MSCWPEDGSVSVSGVASLVFLFKGWGPPNLSAVQIQTFWEKSEHHYDFSQECRGSLWLYIEFYELRIRTQRLECRREVL